MKAKQLLSIAVLTAFFAVAFLSGCAKKESTPEGVFVANLWWDKANLDSGYYTFDEANALAAAYGKRLPTIEEFKLLCQKPQRWDTERRGKWFAENEVDLGNPEKALFLPAAGSRSPWYNEGALSGQGVFGYYWSSMEKDSIEGYQACYVYYCGFYLDSIESIWGINADKAVSSSVRCVAK